jgi:hypothetical protein
MQELLLEAPPGRGLRGVSLPEGRVPTQSRPVLFPPMAFATSDTIGPFEGPSGDRRVRGGPAGQGDGRRGIYFCWGSSAKKFWEIDRYVYERLERFMRQMHGSRGGYGRYRLYGDYPRLPVHYLSGTQRYSIPAHAKW